MTDVPPPPPREAAPAHHVRGPAARAHDDDEGVELGASPEPGVGPGRDSHDEDEQPSSLDLSARYRAMSSDAKLKVKRGGVLLVVAVLGYLGYGASRSGDDVVAKVPEANKLDMGAGLRGDSLETKLRANFEEVLKEVRQTNARVTSIEEGKVPIVYQGPSPAGGRSSGQEGGSDELPAAIPGAPGGTAYPPSPTIDPGSDLASLPPPSALDPPAAPAAPPVVKLVGAIGDATFVQAGAQAAASQSPGQGGEGAQPSGSKKKLRTIYLPPGFMRARLLTGVDALASRDATSNPEPVIARVQAPAVLPNDVKANLSGCFVVGNATGSLAKERVEIQAVTLSCVDFDERSVIDQAIKGFFVDTDGKKGLAGRVVTRAGANLARAFIAGTVTGVSEAISATTGSVSTSALGNVRTFNTGEALTSGVAEGFKGSSEKLTDFYLDLARQASPVVEVGAAKEVVLVIQEGVTLEIRPTAGVGF